MCGCVRASLVLCLSGHPQHVCVRCIPPLCLTWVSSLSVWCESVSGSKLSPPQQTKTPLKPSLRSFLFGCLFNYLPPALFPIKDGDKSGSQSICISPGSLLQNWLLQRQAPSWSSEWMKVERGWLEVSTRRLLPDGFTSRCLFKHLPARFSYCIRTFRDALLFYSGYQPETLFAPLLAFFCPMQVWTFTGSHTAVILTFSLSLSPLSFIQIRRWQVTYAPEPLIVDDAPASLPSFAARLRIAAISHPACRSFAYKAQWPLHCGGVQHSAAS